MPEDYEGFVSLTLRTRNSKKPLRMLERKCKHQWLQLCLARLSRKASMEKSVTRLMSSNQNLRVSWKPVNPQACVLKNLYRIIKKTYLQERGPIHCNIIIWYTNLFLCLKSWKFPRQKGSSGQEMGETWKYSGVEPDESQKWKRGNRWSNDEGRKNSFCLTDGHLSLKECRIGGIALVLLDDIVKDDSGSYAVSTEQGSSASQMTAAEVMDIIAKLPGCAGQAADAVSAEAQVKIQDAPKLLKIPKSECRDIRIRPPRHKWPKSWSSMEDPVVPLERLYGHPLAGLLWERQFGKILLKYGWEGFQLEMLLRTPWKRVVPICVDDIKLAGRKHNIDPMWNVLNKEVDLGDSTSFLDHDDLVCTQTQWKKQRYCWQVQNHVWIQNFRRSNWKITGLGKYEYLFVVLRYHAKKCVERYGELANKTTQQLFQVSTPCIDDHFKEEEMKSVG